ncbi:MAG: hypothetical protein K5850_01945 [Bacteroidales bacterium]|nr:hypothetical protein [Bacteroidales bacterium]
MLYRETQSELTFRKAGTFYHIYTSPLESDILYRNDDELNIILNFIAIAIMFCNCRILAFAVMSNHLHFIIEGPESECIKFFYSLKEKLTTFFRYNGRPGLVDSMEPGCTQINSLEQLRTEIAYVIRNPFVARTDVNPFACSMTSGHLYFNPLLKKEGVPANTLKGRVLRDFTRSRKEIELKGDISVLDGVAQAWSFVDYERAMSFFDSAQQFIMITLKNVEAQVEVAIRYNDPVHLNDQELVAVTMKICREELGQDKPSDMIPKDKMLLATILKNRYHVSNAQAARASGLLLRDVDALFPLAAKRK